MFKLKSKNIDPCPGFCEIGIAHGWKRTTNTLQMKSTTLLIAAAALAAGIISSQAQVYSQNIVGYVNTPLPTGFVNLANPLDGSNANNAITNIIPVFSGAYDGSLLQVWTGTQYTTYTIDSSFSTGIANGNDTAA